MVDDSDDPRHVELETLEAIYPEIRRPNEKDLFTFEIELPVEPAAPVTVTFPAASAGTLPALNVAGSSIDNVQPEVDSLEVSHLPALCLRISLPDGYPVDVPPRVVISTTPQWLAPETIERLQDDGPRLWDEIGRDMVAFTYIDHIQQAADHVFGAISPEGTLQVDPEHKLAVLDHDIKAKKAAFEKETFDCGVCLDPKKGTKCHKMLDCGHIFCLQCLQDFYNDAVNDGNLSTVRCLAPNCAKERSKVKDNGGPSSKQIKKPKVTISPSELLQIGLSEDMVKRYVTLKYKTELESDKNTIYCPRQWCNGAARSKRHKKPEGLDFAETSDGESDHDDKAEDEKAGEKSKKKAKKFNPADFLSVCEDCGFAFCGQCYQSWHGEFVRCAPRREKGELSEEEKASIEYLQLHTSPCPTCNAPAQKTHGCNHMICSRCDTHFCYLCSAWLDPGNPYRHYNTQPGGKVTSCFMRLWELEGGDGDDVGLGFVGGRGDGANQPVAEPAEIDLDFASDESDAEADENNNHNHNNNNLNNRQLDEQGQAVAVAREAPLVLRLVDNQPRDGRNGHRPVPPAAPDAPHPAARGHGPHRGPLGRGRGARGGRGPAGVAGRGAAAVGGGARGGGAGGGGGGGVANRQRQNQRQQQQPQNQGQNNNNNVDHINPPAGLDAAQEEWVRRFVQMALIDAEDEVEGDSDDEGDGWIIQ
ncbi:RWD domain-containing protein [Ilyonectria robusta]|uniref:RWD domain-containing protein n=1 Tax=Ilyonectria robusta TaxID=1079257 RepID=UPI001E8E8253|nr:RWD domain-containing protein [Ilyonectria robusta]KAH8733402.1 RWD domain-containing protein [Ilyonectria robusta]